MKGSFKTALIAAVVSAFVAAGAAVATTKTFVLGTTNTVDAASTVTAGSGLNTKMLQLTNNTTGASATALGLTTPSSRPPMIVSSGAKVANLNADKLDNLDSGYFLPKTGTAANSLKLGGQLPSYYLPKTAKAADSDKLDGIDSTGFVQGRGTFLANRIVTLSGHTSVLLTIPGLGELVATCSTGQALIYWDNTSGGPVDAWSDYDIGVFEGVVYPQDGTYSSSLTTVLPLATAAL